MNFNFIQTFFKGLCVGGTMLVPGVSGGSMAMILGEYDRLVSSVSSFMKHKKESALFLCIFALGGGAGMVAFANPIQKLIAMFPLPMMYFFIGAVAGGVPLMYQKARVARFSWKSALWLLAGVAVVLLLNLLPTGLLSAGNILEERNMMGYGIMLAAGFIAAIALILPGISVSYMLLIMGIYDPVMQAIGGLHFSVLLPLGVGLVLGIVLTTRILEIMMNRYPGATYMVILGFVIGSIIYVFPGLPAGIWWVWCLAALAAGFVIIRLLSAGEEKCGVRETINR